MDDCLEIETDVLQHDTNHSVLVVQTITKPVFHMNGEEFELAPDVTREQMEEVILTLAQTLQATGRANDKLRATLRECADQFDRYAGNHHTKSLNAKTKDDFDAALIKMRVNENFVQHIKDVLAATKVGQ